MNVYEFVFTMMHLSSYGAERLRFFFLGIVECFLWVRVSAWVAWRSREGRLELSRLSVLVLGLVFS